MGHGVPTARTTADRALASLVRTTPTTGRPALVGVDGVDGSGKTTFAARLVQAFEVSGRVAHLVHLDDFLQPRGIRYRLGRDSPEGFFRDTYDLAAFSRAVLDPVRGAGPVTIVTRAFDHFADQPVPAEPRSVAAADAVVVEGMFLHRDQLAGVWDVSVFLDVPFSVSVPRLAQRDGTSPDPDDPSVRRYVEGQRLYLASCRPTARATKVVENG